MSQQIKLSRSYISGSSGHFKYFISNTLPILLEIGRKGEPFFFFFICLTKEWKQIWFWRSLIQESQHKKQRNAFNSWVSTLVTPVTFLQSDSQDIVPSAPTRGTLIAPLTPSSLLCPLLQPTPLCSAPQLLHTLPYLPPLYFCTWDVKNNHKAEILFRCAIRHSGLYHTAKSLQSCPTLCDPIDGSPPGSPVPGILQARTLEWVAISFSNAWKWKMKGKSLSRVWLLATPRTTAYQAPPSMGFSRQEYWSRSIAGSGRILESIAFSDIIVHGVTKSPTWQGEFHFHFSVICQALH